MDLVKVWDDRLEVRRVMELLDTSRLLPDSAIGCSAAWVYVRMVMRRYLASSISSGADREECRDWSRM